MPLEFISVTLALISSCALSVFIILLFIKRLRPHRKTYWKCILISFCVLIFAAIIAPKTAEPTSIDNSGEPQSSSDTTEETPGSPVSEEPAQASSDDSIEPNSESIETESAEQPVSAPELESSTPSVEIASQKSSGVYVGSVDSDKYHKPGCRFAKEILNENEIWFDSAEEAQNSGYSPCGSCHPR